MTRGDEGRGPFQRYRERLAAVGFRPSSVRGQNFLLDPSLHRWIAEQAGPTQQDTVVEIGVGLGFLTRELVQLAGRVLAVEIEARLLEIAREELGGAANVAWLLGDALGGSGRTLLPEIDQALATTTSGAAGERRLVVANLPYSVSGPVLAELAQATRPPDRIVVLVQKELGQRLAAGAGTEHYGGLSALLQALYSVQSLRDVSPSVFRPRPKVWSSVVQFDVRRDAAADLQPAIARRSLAGFLRQVFLQRRKTLRTTLAAACGGRRPGWSDELLRQRAEELSADALVALWRQCQGELDDGPP